MKILFITITDMSKKNGGTICSKAFLDYFLEISDEIVFMLPQSTNYAWDFSELKLVEVPPKSFFNKGMNILSGVSHRFYPYIKKWWDAEERNFDLVVLSGSILGGGIINFLQKKKIPSICIHHNFELDYHRDNKTLASLFGLNLSSIRNAERKSLLFSRLNLTLTVKDTLKLKEYYSFHGKEVQIECIGCFLEKKFSVIPCLCPVDSNKVVISGALCDRQTEEGIIYYLKNLHYILTDTYPQLLVYIAGRNPSLKIMDLCGKLKNIIICPNPTDMDVIIRDAVFYINPTYLGSGLKLRNMDALRYGIPVLSHIKSCSGYEILLEKGVFGYSTPEEFKQRLNMIMENVLDRKQIQTDFYNFFSFQSGQVRLNNILKSKQITGNR